MPKSEEELAKIKALVAPANPRSCLLNQLHGVAGFLLSYWVILSFAAAIGTALYVKFEFQIDYFEQYRNQSTIKKISEFHRQLGDELLGRTEWEAAAHAYKEALESNPNNREASSGLAKAQVFLPEPPQKYPVPEIVDAKLRFLEEQFPNDYIVFFLKGERSFLIGDYKAARESLAQSIQANPRFPGAYLALGDMAVSQSDRAGAIENYGKALALAPQNADALNNLGYFSFLAANYEESVGYFLRSDSIAPQMSTDINLGEAYRAEGNLATATEIHVAALKNAERLKTDFERYWGNAWTSNYQPLFTNDTETIKRYVQFRSQEQKLSLAHFELALDYAGTGKMAAADSEWDKATELEDGVAFRAFYANRMAFFERSPGLNDNT